MSNPKNVLELVENDVFADGRVVRYVDDECMELDNVVFVVFDDGKFQAYEPGDNVAMAVGDEFMAPN